MQPNSPLGQVSQSMAAGQSPLNQISMGSPAAQPGLMPPPNTPMPDRSPASLIHKAAARRGMDLSKHPQLQASFAQSTTPGAPVSSSPSSYNASQEAQPGQVDVPVSQMELIIKALTSRMKTISGHEEKLRDTALSMLVPETQEASSKPQ